MSHEQPARAAHRSGFNCSSSLYRAFSDVNPNTGKAPAPRSEGGKCGALLAGQKLLREMGADDSGFEQAFLQAFGATKCGELRRRGIPCNDLVGGTARMLDERLENR